jgi:hypothetical protein
MRLRQCCNSYTLIAAERYAVAEEVLKVIHSGKTIDEKEATRLLRRFGNGFYTWTTLQLFVFILNMLFFLTL